VRAGRIYVDLDDVLSETIRPITTLLEQRFGRRVAVEDIVHFDLGRSFELSGDDLAELMRLVHEPEVLASFAPNPGAARALEGWMERGYAVAVVTGRPPSSERASRAWLAAHRIPHTEFACVDKYGRPDWGDSGEPAPALDSLENLDFSLAVEDSLEVAARLVERFGVPVALMDRPWNRDVAGLGAEAARGIVRCRGWDEVSARFPCP
jgi:uncharacterized HAD superfamily protein